VSKKASALFLCLLLTFANVISPCLAFVTGVQASDDASADQMAEILGVKDQVGRLLQLKNSESQLAAQEKLALRGFVLQKILTGFLEVRRASNKNDRELSYAFNVMRREQRKQDFINQMFTLANFAQLGTLYTCEPFLRLNGQFKPSAICTTTGGGLGLTLPVANILQQKTARDHNTKPPTVMLNLIDGGPVDASNLPHYVDRFFNTPAVNSSLTRKEEMFALWKERYGVDASIKENLCSLLDKNTQKAGTLRTRILLLWSLRTYILKMDHSLLALLQQVQSGLPSGAIVSNDNAHLKSLGLKPSAVEAAHLLKVEDDVAHLVRLNQTGIRSDSDKYNRELLETKLLGRILSGALEVRVAADEVDAEINYASDVVLAELLAKRGKQLQRNYEVNFIQAGTFGSIAGLLYLKHFSKAGNEMFIISGGIGTCLSVRAIQLMRGGHRRIDTHANALADVFSLPESDQYRFSPMMAAFLNASDPETGDKQTRAQALLQYWKEGQTTSVKLTDQATLAKLAGAKPSQYDTIKIVTNRISMLHGLLARIELLDPALLSLLRATDRSALDTLSETTSQSANANMTLPAPALSPNAAEGANLLNLQGHVSELVSAGSGDRATAYSLLASRLAVVRSVLGASLDVRVASDVVDAEISYEYDVLDRMSRARDHAIAVTNNINFFQLNVLAMIIDGPLGLSGDRRWVRASNMLNIVSGLAVGSLALLTVFEQRGGWRPLPANPNMIGQCLGFNEPKEYKFSPVLWQFINEAPPGLPPDQTRVNLLLSVWKQTKSVTLNMEKQSNREKVAAFGPAHTKWCESIKLLHNRLNMLFDVRGMIGMLDDDLDELLNSLS